MSFPADAIGHHLHMTWPADRDHRRTAACTGCTWTYPAPGTGYGPARLAHSVAHAHLLTEATP